MTEATITAADPGPRIDALPKSLTIGWASGAFGIALLFNGIGALIFFYMVGILKIEPALAGSPGGPRAGRAAHPDGNTAAGKPR